MAQSLSVQIKPAIKYCLGPSENTGANREWLLSNRMIWFHSITTCRSLFTGRGRGRRGELHHPLLRTDGLRGMSHPDRDAGDILPGGPVNLQGSRQEAQTSRFWTRLLHNAGLSHQGLLPGRLPGCTEGKPKCPNGRNWAAGGVWVAACVAVLVESCTSATRLRIKDGAAGAGVTHELVFHLCSSEK